MISEVVEGGELEVAGAEDRGSKAAGPVFSDALMRRRTSIMPV